MNADSNLQSSPPEITETANEASTSLLPQKSLNVHESTYQKKEEHFVSENIMLTYSLANSAPVLV